MKPTSRQRALSLPLSPSLSFVSTLTASPFILSIEPTNPTQEMRVRLTLPGLRSNAARPLRATGIRTCHRQPGLRSNAARPSTATELLRSHPAAGDGGRRKSSTSSAVSWYQSPGDGGRCVLVRGLSHAKFLHQHAKNLYMLKRQHGFTKGWRGQRERRSACRGSGVGWGRRVVCLGFQLDCTCIGRAVRDS